MRVHYIDNWYVGLRGALAVRVGDDIPQRADINDLVELVTYELEQQKHIIQLDSYDQWCEKCQDPATYGCYITNKKIDRRIRELRKQPTDEPVKLRLIK